MKKVAVYSQPNCVPCKLVKNHLKHLGVDFEEKDIANNPKFFDELIGLGFKSTPVIQIGKDFVVGFDPHEIEQKLKA